MYPNIEPNSTPITLDAIKVSFYSYFGTYYLNFYDT
jgi:hypothetical protein